MIGPSSDAEITGVASATAEAGSSATTSTDGVSATLRNAGGGDARLTVATYDGNPVSIAPGLFGASYTLTVRDSHALVVSAIVEPPTGAILAVPGTAPTIPPGTPAEGSPATSGDTSRALPANVWLTTDVTARATGTELGTGVRHCTRVTLSATNYRRSGANRSRPTRPTS